MRAESELALHGTLRRTSFVVPDFGIQRGRIVPT
jgi:hypothetical protein